MSEQSRPGRRELYDRLSAARRALDEAEQRAPWFYIGDVSDGPEIGSLLDEAMIELWHARQALIESMGRPPQEGEQTELALVHDVDESNMCAVAHEGPCRPPCPRCGHYSIDHYEGLRCQTCGCGGAR